MNDDRILEFMALMSEYMRSSDRRHEQMVTVMHNGFGRVTDQLSGLTQEVHTTNQKLDHLTGRVDHLTERVDHLTEEIVEIKTDIREVKTDIGGITRRLGNTFDQAGRLTEQSEATGMRLSHVEGSLQPTNAELDQRLRDVENTLRKLAS